jgi:hypothetical protein
MGGEIELWSLRRFGGAAIRFDWFGSVKRSRQAGAVLPYLAMSCSIFGVVPESSAPRQPGKQMISVEVLIPWLRLLRLGDVWQYGKLAGSEPLERVTFQGLVVDDATTSVGPCGKTSEGSDGVRRHDLPFASFSRHADHTLAYLVRVEAGPGLVLLVPSMELVRFYFGSSGALLQNIFSGAFAKDRLYTFHSKSELTGVANITLAKNVPAMGATTVARIAFDPAARRQFQSIVNSGVRAAANGEPWYPRVSFPFVGATDLTAEGVWLTGAPERVFLAFRLISCTHPFPFTKLYYKVHAETISKLVSRPAAPPKEGKDERKSNDVSVRAGAQDPTLSPALVAAPLDAELVPFPDLLTKQVARVKADTSQHVASKPKPSTGGDEATSVTLGLNRGGASRPVEVSESASAIDSGIDEPGPLRRLRAATASTVPELVIQASSPLDGAKASTRIEVKAGDGTIIAIWASTFAFMPGHDDAKSLLVMTVEDRPNADSPEVVAFDLWEGHEIDHARLAAMARVFCTHDEERDEIADQHSLVGTWDAGQLANGGETAVLQELLEHVVQAEWATVDRSPAPAVAVAPVQAVQASGAGAEGQAGRFVLMFSRFEETVFRIAHEKMRGADYSDESLRDEPDWWTFARQANDVVPLMPGSDLTAAVDRLSKLADAGGVYGTENIEGADDRVERALMAMRSLRSRVVHRQERADGSAGGANEELVAAAILVLNRYLDYDHIFLARYEEATTAA